MGRSEARKELRMHLTEFNRIWSAVYGYPAWSVKQGYGSFLTLEFGQPELRIREPALASRDASEHVRKFLERRLVTVTGNWHLWIYCCNWLITLGGKEAAESESPDEVIAFATRRLDGQKLLSVARGTTPGSWVFAFDLGGELKTRPSGDDPAVEQWMLYERTSGNVLSVRADDHCSYGAGNRTVGDHEWNPI
jgi:hypothetical protein